MPVWSLPRRIAFRFGFVALLVFIYPFPLGLIPKTDKLAEWVNAPWNHLVQAFAGAIGVDAPIQQTGSGDTMFSWLGTVVMILIAAVGAAIWSALDRKRLAYPRLAHAAWILLRYTLAIAMLSYGFAKLLPTQFPYPSPATLEEHVGEMSPMGMLWTFMGSSPAYTVFAGAAEALAGVLLLWRRTAYLGALVAIGVMTNVVMLNLCYDVPVKLYASELLLLAVLVALPRIRPVLAAVLGRAAPEATPWAPFPERYRLALRVIKGLAILSLAYMVYGSVKQAEAYRGSAHELVGTWRVESGAPWKKLMFGKMSAAVRFPDEHVQYFQAEVDSAHHEVAITSGQGKDTWHYAQPDAQHLVLDGTWQGAPLYVSLTREPDPLLVTRGFHWVQEFPFNR